MINEKFKMINNLIIGVVGQIAAGKGVLIEYLTRHYGFISFSLSSIVHDEYKKRVKVGFSNPLTREILQNIGDELRKKEGDAVLAKRAIEVIRMRKIEDRELKIVVGGRKSKIEKNLSSTLNLQPLSSIIYYRPSIIIDGIRNPGEIEFLKKNPNFILIGIKAKRELRFERLLSRAKPWDPKTWGDFLKVDRRDNGVGQNKSGQQVGKCLAYCDYILTNNKDLEDLERKIKRLMIKFK